MSLRRVVFALAVLCLFVGVASAQFTTSQQLSCTVTSSSQPTLRSESLHELVGDVLIQCTGGTAPAPTTNQVPAVDITVSYGTTIASRQNPVTVSSVTTTYSDIAMVIDDPNSLAGANALVSGYGPSAPLIPCTAAIVANASSPACATWDEAVSGYYVSSNAASAGAAGAATPAPNVYPGIITGGGTSVTFYGVPVAAPVSSGVYRRFRVVNVRVAPGSATISATVTTNSSGSTGIMQFPTGTTATVGAGQTAFAYSVTNSSGGSTASILSQCISPLGLGTSSTVNTPYVALLNFKQNFANAAKPIGPTVVAGGLVTYGNYTNESGVILPNDLPGATTLANKNGANATILGAADAGTRFKATFAGLPYSSVGSAQPTLYVSLYNVSSFTADASGAGAGTQVAQLNPPPGNPSSEFSQLGAAPAGFGVGTGAVVAVPITISSTGTATAVWEVTSLAAAKSTGTFTFAVYIQYGTAMTTLGNSTVTLSAAPIQPSTQPTGGELVQIPSFTTSPTSAPLMTVLQCQTALLFPFVTTATVNSKQHWETGIAISNTGSDPWNTVAATAAGGTCTVSFYGTGASSGSSQLSPPTVTGPAIVPGGNWAFVASDPLVTGTAPNVGFSGYAFAVCNFSYAHGFAFIEDNSAAGNAMGYLALVVNNGNALNTRAAALTGEALLQ